MTQSWRPSYPYEGGEISITIYHPNPAKQTCGEILITIYHPNPAKQTYGENLITICHPKPALI